MERAFPAPADAAAVAEVVGALESSLYGQTTFSQADLEDEWSDLDLEQDVRVVRDGDRVVGYGVVCERGELWRVEGYVHPDALGRGIGKLTAAGTICTGDTYGGGWVHAVFTRRPWRNRGVGAALLADSFARFWERGEHSVGLGVDPASDTGAFRLYERAGMVPVLSWVVYEKELAAPA
jgi:GNAT superfamily N-acetyltransferase